jgi:uncharacterized protein (DUF2384 family)
MTDSYHRETLNRLVVALVGNKLSTEWWKSPNKAFEDRSPESLMNESEWTRVRDYLFSYSYGEYS